MSMRSGARIRVFLVDDHLVVRAGLKQLLNATEDIEVAGEAACGLEALSKAPAVAPDVLLLDLRLPDIDGLVVSQKLKELLPQLRVLVLTSYLDDKTVLRTMTAGVDGYILKEIDEMDLGQAIRNVASGLPTLSPAIARTLMNLVRPEKNPLEKLNAQERKIVSLVASGYRNKEIASELGLAEKSIRNYLSVIMQKLNVDGRAEAAALFVRHREG